MVHRPQFLGRVMGNQRLLHDASYAYLLSEKLASDFWTIRVVEG
jgi:hypothetical protein